MATKMFSLFRHLSQGRRDGAHVDFFLIAAVIAVTCVSTLRALVD
jgi:Flp pilus assembly pilin Flp